MPLNTKNIGLSLTYPIQQSKDIILIFYSLNMHLKMFL